MQETPSGSVLAAIKDRITHPVTGVFLLAWAICNWRFLFILAVDAGPAVQRMDLAMSYTGHLKGWILPTAITVGYLLIAPPLRALASWWNDVVAEREADRSHGANLQRLRRHAEITQLSLVHNAQAVADQQAAKTMAETATKQRQAELAALEKSIADLVLLASPQWKSSFPGLAKEARPELRREAIQEIRNRFKGVAELRDRLVAKYPELSAEN